MYAACLFIAEMLMRSSESSVVERWTYIPHDILMWCIPEATEDKPCRSILNPFGTICLRQNIS